jgi:hypothetical protein
VGPPRKRAYEVKHQELQTAYEEKLQGLTKKVAEMEATSGVTTSIKHDRFLADLGEFRNLGGNFGP